MAIGDVKARIVRSDGQEMTLGDGEWRIPKEGLENWANLPYNVSAVEIPSYDGALVTSKRVSSVDRTITAQVGDSRQNAALRARAIRFFNPKHSFTVYLTYMGRTRWCKGELIGFKASEGNIYDPVEIVFTILCPNPYLQSVENFGKDIAEIVPGFGFPFMSLIPSEEQEEAHVQSGFIAGYRMFKHEIELSNDGDVPSGMIVELSFDGDVVNPSINVMSASIKIISALKHGDKVVLDCSSKPPSVTLNGNNAMNLLDRNSNILDMEVGVGGTTVSYDADSGEQFVHATIRYYKQYLGV